MRLQYKFFAFNFKSWQAIVISIDCLLFVFFLKDLNPPPILFIRELRILGHKPFYIINPLDLFILAVNLEVLIEAVCAELSHSSVVDFYAHFYIDKLENIFLNNTEQTTKHVFASCLGYNKVITIIEKTDAKLCQIWYIDSSLSVTV